MSKVQDDVVERAYEAFIDSRYSVPGELSAILAAAQIAYDAWRRDERERFGKLLEQIGARLSGNEGFTVTFSPDCADSEEGK